MKNLIISIGLLLSFFVSHAQETLLVNQKLPDKLVAVYNVLKNDPKIKDGLYQVRRNKKMAIVSGVYKNDKRTGIWHYFDTEGTLVQNFDYSANQLTYEAPDDVKTGIKYIFDKDFKQTDLITKPIRIGGRYYGYLPYLNLFQRPKDLYGLDNSLMNVSIELLVSPGGLLADYNIHISSNYYNFERTLNVNLDLLPLEDKIFIPATINQEPVASRITIPCHLGYGNELVF